MPIHGYHAHVYFDAATRPVASDLRDNLMAAVSRSVRVHGLIDEPIGPHPLPMFEIDIPQGALEPVLNFLQLNHGPLSILVHPISGNELADHRDHSIWIGKQLSLDLSVLR
jgi:aromatic ring-cleaving dioxygenase